MNAAAIQTTAAEPKGRKCACGCGETFPVTKSWRRYLNDQHRIAAWRANQFKKLRRKLRREILKELREKNAD